MYLNLCFLKGKEEPDTDCCVVFVSNSVRERAREPVALQVSLECEKWCDYLFCIYIAYYERLFGH